MRDSENEVYCVNCGARAALVLRPHAVERAGKLIVVRDVPMYECDSCAETYLSTDVMRELDGLIAALLNGRADEAIVRYPAAA